MATISYFVHLPPQVRPAYMAAISKFVAKSPDMVESRYETLNKYLKTYGGQNEKPKENSIYCS
jgi:hypothetical protein